jgi:hypothetical protein
MSGKRLQYRLLRQLPRQYFTRCHRHACALSGDQGQTMSGIAKQDKPPLRPRREVVHRQTIDGRRVTGGTCFQKKTIA